MATASIDYYILSWTVTTDVIIFQMISDHYTSNKDIKRTKNFCSCCPPQNNQIVHDIQLKLQIYCRYSISRSAVILAATFAVVAQFCKHLISIIFAEARVKCSVATSTVVHPHSSIDRVRIPCCLSRCLSLPIGGVFCLIYFTYYVCIEYFRWWWFISIPFARRCRTIFRLTHTRDLNVFTNHDNIFYLAWHRR